MSPKATVIRLGLIGAGRWGRNYITTIASMADVRLTWLARRHPERGSPAGADCGIVTEWRELLTKRDVDGVIIATPPALHAEMAGAAVQSGLPVLVEKPLTLDLGEARELKRLAEELQGAIMVDHTHLFHPAFRALKEHAKELGALRFIRADAGNQGPIRGDAPVLWDWGPHDVAMCLDLAGASPKRVSAAVIAARKERDGVGETLRLRLGFGAGLEADIRVSNISDKRRRFAVYCDGGVLVYDDLAADKLMLHPPLRDTDVPLAEGIPVQIEAALPLAVAVREFAAAIAAKKFDNGGMELAVGVVEVLSRCRASLSSGSAC